MEIYINWDEKVDLAYLLQDIRIKHSIDLDKLVKSEHSSSYSYGFGMIVFFIMKDLNPRVSSMDTVFEDDGRLKAVQYGLLILILDGRPHQNAVKMLKEETKEFTLATTYASLILCTDVGPVFQRMK